VGSERSAGSIRIEATVGGACHVRHEVVVDAELRDVAEVASRLRRRNLGVLKELAARDEHEDLCIGHVVETA
jgi:hypothetical protein